MTKRPCPDCGTPTAATRCVACESTYQRKRNARRAHYRGQWTTIARLAVAAHRAEYGDWCPGWQCPPHPATDLTADHVEPRSLARGVRVLCRSCNARRGATP